MDDIFFSHKEFRALLSKLNELNEDVTTIKLKSLPETGFIDNYDLMKLLQISNRTASRWRKEGRLPYSKVGGKFYYRADTILNSIKIHPDLPDENPYPLLTNPDSENDDHDMACTRCPLFLILNS